jgi:hypothetical protein
MHAAVSSLNSSLKLNPSSPKKRFDASRSFTGRFTKIMRGIGWLLSFAAYGPSTRRV